MPQEVKSHLIELKCVKKNGEPLIALFAPEKGMNLLSYKIGNIDLIDQSTFPLFEERFAGLGALIGPHFHHRTTIPAVPDETLFPHIMRLKKKGVLEPFSHGIGRYAPWTVEKTTQTEIKAILKGSDVWNGTALKVLEGQDFIMRYSVEISPEGLLLDLSVESEHYSVVGFHTYYAMGKNGIVTSTVEDEYSDQGVVKPLPSEWKEKNELNFDLTNACDFGFFPKNGSLKGLILLKTATHGVEIAYQSKYPDHSWQLWHPKGLSFVCIEPLSAKNPRQPLRKESRLKVIIKRVS